MKRAEKLQWNLNRFTKNGRTRGPWKYEKTDMYSRHVVGYDGQSVATVLGGSAGFLPQRMPNDYEAHEFVVVNNAKLICASPDMYELLKKIADNDVQDLMDKYPVAEGFYSQEFAIRQAIRVLLEYIEGDHYQKKSPKNEL